jgi:hypothetical protein
MDAQNSMIAEFVEVSLDVVDSVDLVEWFNG